MWLTSNFQIQFLSKWSQIFTKYFSYQQIMVVFEGDISKIIVGLGITEIKSDPHIVKICVTLKFQMNIVD